MSYFKKYDRVRVTLRTGPHAAREGTVVDYSKYSNIVAVEFEPDEIHYFVPADLEVFDPAPVVKTGAPTVNKILREMDEDLLQLLEVQSTLQGYRMNDTAKDVDNQTGVLLKVIQNLKWALKEDGLYEETE